MFFELTFQAPNGQTQRTHVGVSSFSAPEGQIGITEKVAKALGLDLEALGHSMAANSSFSVNHPRIGVQFVRLPKADFVQFTPTSGHFVSAASNSWGGVKTVLEVALQHYATLTVG